MKKAILLATVLFVSLGITACTKVDKVQNKEEIKINKEEQEEKFLTEEEMKEINENVEKYMRASIKYKFAKVIGTNETKLEVVFVETPENYRDKGYNEDLNIDTSKLKETKEKGTVELIGADSNITPDELKQGIEGIYIRIGTFEPEEDDNKFDMEKGMITSIDSIK